MNEFTIYLHSRNSHSLLLVQRRRHENDLTHLHGDQSLERVTESGNLSHGIFVAHEFSTTVRDNQNNSA